MSITYHINNKIDLDATQNLSTAIFKPSPEELLKYHNKVDWSKKIDEGGLLITGWDGNVLAGFSLCFPKPESFHIRMTGVAPAYRKLGIWKTMHEMILKYARENGFKKITVSTSPTRFPEMYKFITTSGYREYTKEEDRTYFYKTLVDE